MSQADLKVRLYECLAQADLKTRLYKYLAEAGQTRQMSH